MILSEAIQAQKDIDDVGHVATFKRVTGSFPNQTTVSKDVKAVISGYKPEELINGITLGSRKIIVSTLSLSASGFPLPIVKGDRVVVQGKELLVETVDADHREYLGCLDIVAKGD